MYCPQIPPGVKLFRELLKQTKSNAALFEDRGDLEEAWGEHCRNVFFEAIDNSAFKLGKARFETYREAIIVIIIHYQ